MMIVKPTGLIVNVEGQHYKIRKTKKSVTVESQVSRKGRNEYHCTYHNFLELTVIDNVLIITE